MHDFDDQNRCHAAWTTASSWARRDSARRDKMLFRRHCTTGNPTMLHKGLQEYGSENCSLQRVSGLKFQIRSSSQLWSLADQNRYYVFWETTNQLLSRHDALLFRRRRRRTTEMWKP